MSKSERFAWPYQRLSESPFGDDDLWLVSFGGESPVPVPVVWRGWDALSSATFRRNLRIDPMVVREQAGLALAGDVAFRIAVTASTANGRLRQVVWVGDVHGLDPQEFNVCIELGADHGRGLLGKGGLARDIQLQTGLYLVQAVEDAGVFSASRPGHILYSEEVSLSLDDDETAVPMIAVSFKKGFLGITAPAANYYVGLEAVEDATSLFRATVVIYVNTDTGFDLRLTEGDPEALSEVYAGLAMQLSMHLLLNSMLEEEEGPYPSGTVGAVAEGFLASAFPGRSLEGLEQQLKVRPAEFMVRMQDMSIRNSSELFR